MNAITDYKRAKQALTNSHEWASMLGKQYHGGGGGVGKLAYLNLATQDLARPTIYYQYRDGATNYHDAPLPLLPHLEAAIAERFPELLARALERQAAALEGLAAKAADEYAVLMREAGLAPGAA